MDRFLDMLRPMICRWALVWTGSPDESEDVAQAVLLKVSRSLRGSSMSSAITTWAYKITANTLIDFERRSGRERRRLDSLGGELSQRSAEPNALDRLSSTDLLTRFLRDLSPQQRAALDLVLQGFTQAEAADMLGVEAATIRVHLHRARQAIARRTRSEDQTQEA